MIQNNKLLDYVDVPSWMYCDMQGTSIDNSISSSVEMDVYDNDIQEYIGIPSCKGEVLNISWDWNPV